MGNRNGRDARCPSGAGRNGRDARAVARNARPYLSRLYRFLPLVLPVPSFRSRAKKEGALFSHVPVEALRKPCVAHERDMHPVGCILCFAWHTR